MERTANADQRIAVVTTIPDSVTVAAPPRALTIVCANLVRNAFRHAPGPLHILLDGDRLVFEDAGAGVGDHRPGRGLSIVARLCEHHGWQFSVTQHAKGMRAAIDFGGDLTQT